MFSKTCRILWTLNTNCMLFLYNFPCFVFCVETSSSLECWVASCFVTISSVTQIHFKLNRTFIFITLLLHDPFLTIILHCFCTCFLHVLCSHEKNHSEVYQKSWKLWKTYALLLNSSEIAEASKQNQIKIIISQVGVVCVTALLHYTLTCKWAEMVGTLFPAYR